MRGSDGRITFLRSPILLDDELARSERDIEETFRFAEPCAADDCGHWASSRCGLVETLTSALERSGPDPLPACAIRPRCVWFHQRRDAACRTCRHVTRHSCAAAADTSPTAQKADTTP